MAAILLSVNYVCSAFLSGCCCGGILISVGYVCPCDVTVVVLNGINVPVSSKTYFNGICVPV